MDQPDEVYCYQCHACIGWQSPDEFVWRCPQCHKLSQLSGDDHFIEATPELLRLIKKLEAVHSEYRTQQDPYTTKIYGGRSIGFRSFEPTSHARAVSVFGPTFLLVGVGFIFLFTPYLYVAAIFFVFAIVVGFLLGFKSEDSVRHYEALEVQRIREIAVIKDAIRRSIETS